ncbi:SigE family RNA polymerase sigma factor [Amorphoplanes digitatis]|uniref:RNA polymerase sigma-70 factor (Sigma-E family) n=1 Tax=Actinoplanes digitatis TaxID=1868 RepID=A0A7W7I6H3_9ACTN|nr:SigE family RNA polymerase sigma factor [Actinoplanes digitatis]MBB4767073.1 RNA polymerase sigma-70 factor (sigma-E family) [Actinoplanes digitatis]BFE77358.1 SigE family RNA polymerase sigma factor [Actinoplanes digitatis]GID95562.1 RNA polymerase sigma24 factor [Actinoplanes digitatis]
MDDGTDAEYLAYVNGRVTALRRFAFLLCGDGHQTDDLLQETFTKLYARWPRICRVENVDAYVHTMIVRSFLDEKRRGWWRVGLFDSAPDRPTPEPAGFEEQTVVRAALSQVPPRQQAVLVLRFLCDKPVDEVAQILGCSPGTVKSQTSHGLNKLRRILGDRIPATNGEGGWR